MINISNYNNFISYKFNLMEKSVVTGKLVLLGDSNVGKTTLSIALFGSENEENENTEPKPTLGATFLSK